jgi:formyltetrahydrofolate deformylase
VNDGPGRYGDIGRLLLSCSDRPGIVAAITRFLYEFGANIIHSDQHTLDPFGGQFFIRIEFHLSGLEQREDELRGAFSHVAGTFEANWRLSIAKQKKRVALFASRADHALLELLWRIRNGDLYADVKMVISNHPNLEPMVRSLGIPFHHVPMSAALREQAERHEWELMGEDIDLIVLARYMQVLSPAFLARYPNRIINIHHSFLPAFVGADPYAAAYERGVKLIGATAHYVTQELDAGPIIDQDVMRVDHSHSVEDMRRIGRYVERSVLARAVDWHLQDRIIVFQNKTIVF